MSAILLYDGTCGFCARNVQFVLQHERRRQTLQFAALQNEIGMGVRERHPELDSIDSVIWVEPGTSNGTETVYVRSAAVLQVLRYLGGVWSILAAVASVVPPVIRDWVYDFVAQHRHQIIRGDTSCLLPTPEQRARFIDREPASAA